MRNECVVLCVIGAHCCAGGKATDLSLPMLAITLTVKCSVLNTVLSNTDNAQIAHYNSDMKDNIIVDHFQSLYEC